MSVSEVIPLRVVEERKNYPNIDLRKIIQEVGTEEEEKLRKHIERRVNSIVKKYGEKFEKENIAMFKRFCELIGGKYDKFFESCIVNNGVLSFTNTGQIYLLRNSHKQLISPRPELREASISLVIVQHVDKSIPDKELVILHENTRNYELLTSSGVFTTSELRSRLSNQEVKLSVSVTPLTQTYFYCVKANSPEEAIAKIYKWRGLAFECSKALERGEKPGVDFNYIVAVRTIYITTDLYLRKRE